MQKGEANPMNVQPVAHSLNKLREPEYMPESGDQLTKPMCYGVDIQEYNWLYANEREDMQAIIDVFRMTELSVEARIKVMKKLGTAINHQLAWNVTEPLVYELVLALDPVNEIKTDRKYLQYL